MVLLGGGRNIRSWDLVGESKSLGAFLGGVYWDIGLSFPLLSLALLHNHHELNSVAPAHVLHHDALPHHNTEKQSQVTMD
jgi:hypothetical protein